MVGHLPSGRWSAAGPEVTGSLYHAVLGGHDGGAILQANMRRLRYAAIGVAALVCAGAAAVAARFFVDEKAPCCNPLWHKLGASAIVVKRMYARYPRDSLLALTSWQMLAMARW